MSTFTCDNCGGTWEKGPDVDAVREHIALWGRPPDADTGVLCDDCHTAFIGWLASLTPEQRLDLAEADHGSTA